MNKRIFICADVRFPREDPGANRIQYVAQALMNAGHDVTIISCGRTDADVNEDGYCYYRGIRYQNISQPENKFAKKIKVKVLSGISVLAVLKTYKPTENDYIYIYSSNTLFIYPILKYSEKEKIRTYIEVVEWHQPFEYKYGSVNPRCISTKAAFYKMAPRVGNILAISNKIADYYEKNNCHVEVFPVFVDTDSQNLDNQIVDKNYIHLIYPGNPINKDNVATMMKALLSLERCELEKIIFHMTGNTEKQIRNILCKEDFLIDKLGEHIVFHGWMEYEDLIDLYHKMDFLYMSRFDNAVSQANFPSKLPELMGWGIVPVCNKVGDYYHYLTDNENAIIFETDSVEDCVNALKRVLLLSPEERQQMRKNARQCAIDKFDYRSWQKKLMDFMGL